MWINNIVPYKDAYHVVFNFCSLTHYKHSGCHPTCGIRFPARFSWNGRRLFECIDEVTASVKSSYDCRILNVGHIGPMFGILVLPSSPDLSLEPCSILMSIY